MAEIQKKENTETKPTKKVETKMSKQQILSSNKWKHRKDLLSVILEDDKMYTTTQVDEAINKFMKGKVN